MCAILPLGPETVAPWVRNQQSHGGGGRPFFSRHRKLNISRGFNVLVVDIAVFVHVGGSKGSTGTDASGLSSAVCRGAF